MSVIFTTIHGSRLYGLHHAGSDHDSFTVVTDKHDFGDRPTRQTVRGFGDHVRDDITFTLREFMKRADNGSHQALEAMFSPVKEWPNQKHMYRRYIESWVIGSPDVFAAYERTIRKFAFEDFKRRRHGVRLAQNLKALREFGRFNPRMTVAQIQEANEYATTMSGNAFLRGLDIPLSQN
mgnify:FL=1